MEEKKDEELLAELKAIGPGYRKVLEVAKGLSKMAQMCECTSGGAKDGDIFSPQCRCPSGAQAS